MQPTVSDYTLNRRHLFIPLHCKSAGTLFSYIILSISFLRICPQLSHQNQYKFLKKKSPDTKEHKKFLVFQDFTVGCGNFDNVRKIK